MSRCPISSRRRAAADYIGGFSVTAGIGEDDVADRFKHAQRRLFRDHGQGAGGSAGRSLRRAAAPARAQEFWGYAPDETFTPRADRGKISRHPPAPGYPAQPDHTEKATLFALIDGDGRSA
jgi:5-methyltetrahydrofolate--homocysteine methyltransferase